MSSKNKWTLETVEQEVLGIIKQEKQLDDGFTLNSPLEEVGIDSLTLVRVLVAIDNSLGVWLEGGSLTPENLRDVESLSLCVARQIDGCLP